MCIISYVLAQRSFVLSKHIALPRHQRHKVAFADGRELSRIQWPRSTFHILHLSQSRSTLAISRQSTHSVMSFSTCKHMRKQALICPTFICLLQRTHGVIREWARYGIHLTSRPTTGHVLALRAVAQPWGELSQLLTPCETHFGVIISSYGLSQNLLVVLSDVLLLLLERGRGWEDKAGFYSWKFGESCWEGSQLYEIHKFTSRCLVI